MVGATKNGKAIKYADKNSSYFEISPSSSNAKNANGKLMSSDPRYRSPWEYANSSC
jgi:hypothetical protein